MCRSLFFSLVAGGVVVCLASSARSHDGQRSRPDAGAQGGELRQPPPVLAQYQPVNQNVQTGVMLSLLGLMLTVIAVLVSVFGWMAKAKQEQQRREEAEQRLREAQRQLAEESAQRGNG